MSAFTDSSACCACTKLMAASLQLPSSKLMGPHPGDYKLWKSKPEGICKPLQKKFSLFQPCLTCAVKKFSLFQPCLTCPVKKLSLFQPCLTCPAAHELCDLPRAHCLPFLFQMLSFLWLKVKQNGTKFTVPQDFQRSFSVQELITDRLSLVEHLFGCLL